MSSHPSPAASHLARLAPLAAAFLASSLSYWAAYAGPSNYSFFECTGPPPEHELRRRMPQLINLADLYRLSHAGRCPVTVKEIVRGGLIRSEPKDPWGNSYRLTCMDDTGDISIVSAGPDELFRTEDDVSSAHPYLRVRWARPAARG